MLTAAHCLVNSPANYGNNWKHNTLTQQTIGNAYGGTIADADGPPGDGCLCHSDVGWIDIDYFATTLPQDLFYASSNTDIRNVIDVPADNSAQQQVGAFICRGGGASQYVCGAIDVVNASRTNLDGHNVDTLRRTNFDASPGDSGAVMFLGDSFMGIHNDSLTGVDPPEAGHSWYSTGGRITSLGNDVCVASVC